MGEHCSSAMNRIGHKAYNGEMKRKGRIQLVHNKQDNSLPDRLRDRISTLG